MAAALCYKASQMLHEDCLPDELRNGQDDAWSILYRHFKSELLWRCCWITHDDPVSEEIVNDCIERVSKRMERFASTEELRKFLYRSVKNACIDHFRKTGTRQKLLKALMAALSETDEDDCIDADQRLEGFMQQLLAAVDQLPPQQREASRLVFVREVTREKAAELMGIGIQAVYNLLTQARENLKKQFGDLPFF